MAKKTGGSGTLELGGSNIISNWFFIWVFRLLARVNTIDAGLELLTLKKTETSKIVGSKLEKNWQKEITRSSIGVPSIRRALFATFRGKYLLIGVYKIFWAAFIYLGAYLFLKRLIQHSTNVLSEEDHSSYVTAHVYAVVLFLSAIFSSICIHQLSAECTRIGVQVRAALMVLIYRKALKLSTVQGGVGDVVNLVAEDCNRIAEACVHFHYLWGTALEILAVIAIAAYELRLAALPAVAILIIFFPIQYALGQLTSRLSTDMARSTTYRVYLMSEILTAIKLIKFHAWEMFFCDRVSKARAQEMVHLRRGLLAKCWSALLIFGTPILLTVICFVMAEKIGSTRELTATLVFTILSTFNTLRYPFVMLPMAVRTTYGAFISFERIDRFLLQPEVKPLSSPEHPPADNRTKIDLQNATFCWTSNSDPTIKDFSLKVKKGEIVAIVGDVGAGKSSLLLAIMGQITKTGGALSIFGSIAYVPFDSWLLNASLRDNILFGSPYDPEKYKMILQVCALSKDLEQLSYGDETEIGEHGFNLTLAQRHRVSLARAAYSSADIVLLDDTLSSMATQTGKHIFNECIRGFMKDKAVVFVTNQPQYLPECDFVVVMKSGMDFVRGTYEELLAQDFNVRSLIGESIEIEDPFSMDDFQPDTRHEQLPPNAKIRQSDDNGEPSAQRSSSENIPSVSFADPRSKAYSSNIPRVKTLGTPGMSGNNSSHLLTTNNTDANELTIHRLIELNARTATRAEATSSADEQTVVKIIERNQLTVIGGGAPLMGQALPNRELNSMAKAIEQNQLTIHSLHHGVGGNSSEVEENETQAQKLSSITKYKYYFQGSPGVTITIAVIVLFFVVHAVRTFSDYWLKLTVDSSDPDLLTYYLPVYAGLGAAFLIGIALRGHIYIWVVIKKTTSYHTRALNAIMQARMSYFDYTPLSRILNVFARHQYLIDDYLTEAALQALQFLPLIFMTLLLIMILVPYSIIAVVLLLILVGFLIWYSRVAEENLKMLEAYSKPQLFAHLSATLEGLSSIRVYKLQTRFDSFNLLKIDVSSKALYAKSIVKAWLSLYIDLTASLFVYIVALLILSVHREGGAVKESKVGLVLTNALQLLVFGQWTVQALRDVHGSMSNVKQLVEFTEDIPSEAALMFKDVRPPENWPQDGQIEYQNVLLRYNRYGVAVLKNVSFKIHAKEKVGIVGRTGSGKSTLLVSLLRIVEAAEGKILVDGLDISTIGLCDLRNKIDVIPQEPVLFVGTIRSNLDPFDRCAENEIWSALEAVHMSEKIKSMPLKLDEQVVENGKNFSLGQRQLLCIARAILTKCKILLLDEATSAIDMQTDQLVQETIKKNFVNYTVLTIAHRLNTIIESDRILVLDEGKVVEFDTPINLLNNPEGFFYSLVKRNGNESLQKLRNMAMTHTTQNPRAQGPSETSSHRKDIIPPSLDVFSQHNNTAPSILSSNTSYISSHNGQDPARPRPEISQRNQSLETMFSSTSGTQPQQHSNAGSSGSKHT
ncbi:P-loop containing nucleoside triphosphate hydrolase protein [Basidiobolus meristosporus CBS 931.73]|uniref:p-loop containing nucleoside triphosphate hydrolase protein n=1 Tax=Basidiobolus meristosporus CBS 931.73 TaxID=1314790 RepID=A0A1Y1XSS4_9FUNG|nr:P-loop containing nucleoside triphosphate hydrolase protein [Basidiobolus meristosporus CBS 931.73]|eukprot:ORX88735.1 P-loop containing nucleoside triphosphate hydrolase protein [Basidiobolus meristosporus CBS 931.73]